MNTQQLLEASGINLNALVETFGNNNWDQIVSVLAEQNINIKAKSIEKLWYKLEPYQALEGFTEKNQIQILRIGMSVFGSSLKIYSQYCCVNQQYKGSEIKLYSAYEFNLRKALCCIARILGRKKQELIKYYKQLDLVIIKYHFKYVPLDQADWISYNNQCQSVRRLSDLIWCYTRCYELCRSERYQEFIKISSKSIFEQVHQSTKQLTIIRDIARHKITKDEQLEGLNFIFKTIQECKVSLTFKQFVKPLIYWNPPLVSLPIDYELIRSLLTDIPSQEYFDKYGKEIILEDQHLGISEDFQLYKDFIAFIDPDSKFEFILEKNPYLQEYMELMKQIRVIRLEFTKLNEKRNRIRL